MYCTRYNIKHTSKSLDYSKEMYFITNKGINKSISKFPFIYVLLIISIVTLNIMSLFESPTTMYTLD